MAFLLFSCSLRDGSRSQVMVEALRTELGGAGHEVEYLDLREAELPLCDGDDCYDHPATKALRASVAAADGIIFAVPEISGRISEMAHEIVRVSQALSEY